MHPQHCIGTCTKLNDEWRRDDSIFKPFKEDIFGKCDICFRAGFCSIAECKMQQEKEAEIINKIVDTATITGIKEDIVQKLKLEAFPGSISNDLNTNQELVLNNLEKSKNIIKDDVTKSLNAALSLGNVSAVAGRIQSIIDNSFSKKNTFANSSLTEFNNFNIQLKNGNNNSVNSADPTTLSTAKNSEEKQKEIKKKEEEALNNYKTAVDSLIKQTEKLLKEGSSEQIKKEQIVKIKEGIKNNEELMKLATSSSFEKGLKPLIETKKNLESLLNKSKKNESADSNNMSKDESAQAHTEKIASKKTRGNKNEKKNKRKKRKGNY